MKLTRRVFAMLLTLALLCGAGLAEMVFDGVVTGGEAQFVLAPFGGVLDTVSVRAGDRVRPGQVLATIQTTRVYADVEGTVSGVFGREGDATEGISERYGGVLFIEPTNKYTIAASTEKAYNRSENKFIHVGETVYLKCTSDGSHRGTGVVTGMGEKAGEYNVEVTGGEFYVAETVGIYRRSDYAESSRIGRGTVAAAKAVAIKGSGSILKMHVKNGDFVERGELLFETVTGGLDGLYAPGNEIICEVSGIVASVDAGAGSSVEKGGKILSIYPDEGTRIEMQVRESDLGLVREGMKVDIEFNWDLQRMTRFEGTITGISYLSASAGSSGEGGETAAATTGEEPTYTAYVDFTPDESVRLGMTVLVYTRESHDDAGDDPAQEVPEQDAENGEAQAE
ncbi:MAG TPA: HlyD family efflux transporter periplasmic adaptor subunit [Candidatus Pullichristensenella stercorigallinarum]|uniref:HlyD family efflux transporter periplasmic adaptor subunit n=1 Tax=Candidatus Pullichristensenella stercorigallinarum TaxID=2840909 RepID=A0A9D1CVM0_9FIRM|nr:HlyD family efflux transporter periplasmic adaptor subunit [Candidatus Pullichristensenella stercorigallinarum]